MGIPFLSVEQDAKAPAGAKLVMRDPSDNSHDIHTLQDFVRVWLSIVERGWPEDMGFACSSSVDFPEEYTENEDFIAMCNAIRA
jgi:hypothetical protein